jgi:phosphoribosylaminoimidazole-succinocarboxamide synthase
MDPDALLETHLPEVPRRRGKVRDVYDFGDRLLIVATDRISAFDRILPTGIPDKGRVLTALSEFWFNRLGTPHHLLSLDPSDCPLPVGTDLGPLLGRSMVVEKTSPVPLECVARGYLAGSAWAEYSRNGRVCGVELPAGLVEASRLPEPIFTPATKADEGHDENISFEHAASRLGPELVGELRQRTLSLYDAACRHAIECGIIVADTKFEFGTASDGRVILIDEALTPDSSRFWPRAGYQAGGPQPSFDKQFIRDWLIDSGWDVHGSDPPPMLPDEIVAATRAKYVEAFEHLTGAAWK